MEKVFSLKHIALAALIIAGGAFMFASNRSDSPPLTAEISSVEVIDQVDPQQETEPQASPTVQPPAEETAPAEVEENTAPEPPPTKNTATQDEQPNKETAPDATAEPSQENDSEQSPALTSIAVSPVSVKPGESITITIATSGEIFSVIQIDAYLESPSGLTTVNGAVINVDGDGNRFGSIPVPSGAEQGTWKIKTVEIMDNTGTMTTYHYGTDIFTTFDVVAP